MSNRQYPKIGIAALIQRANDLVVACRNDRAELEKAGLEWELVEKTASMVNLAADAAAQYQVARERSARLTLRHKEFVLECRQLRSILAENLRIAERKKQIVLNVPSYKKRRLHANLVQDLYDLGVICRDNRECIEATGFDFALEAQAFQKSEELAEQIAERTVACSSGLLKLHTARNLLFDELHRTIQYICMFGRKVFKDNQARKKNYYAVK